MIQSLIILYFLNTQTEKEREKISALAEGTVNKSVVFSWNMTPDQEAWILEARLKCISILEKTIPNGRSVTKTLLSILSHEKNWHLWKLTSCQSYEKSPAMMSEVKKGPLITCQAVKKPNAYVTVTNLDGKLFDRGQK